MASKISPMVKKPLPAKKPEGDLKIEENIKIENSMNFSSVDSEKVFQCPGIDLNNETSEIPNLTQISYFKRNS